MKTMTSYLFIFLAIWRTSFATTLEIPENTPALLTVEMKYDYGSSDGGYERLFFEVQRKPTQEGDQYTLEYRLLGLQSGSSDKVFVDTFSNTESSSLRGVTTHLQEHVFNRPIVVGVKDDGSFVEHTSIVHPFENHANWKFLDLIEASEKDLYWDDALHPYSISEMYLSEVTSMLLDFEGSDVEKDTALTFPVGDVVEITRNGVQVPVNFDDQRVCLIDEVSDTTIFAHFEGKFSWEADFSSIHSDEKKHGIYEVSGQVQWSLENPLSQSKELTIDMYDYVNGEEYAETVTLLIKPWNSK